MTKMAAMLKMLKAFKALLQNYWANFLETWYVASGTVVLQNLYKTSSWVDLDLIYGRGHFWFHRHWMGKVEMTHFLLLLYSRIWKWSELHHMNARGHAHFRAVSPWTSDMVIYIYVSTSLLPLVPSIRWAFTGPMVLWFYWQIINGVYSFENLFLAYATD